MYPQNSPGEVWDGLISIVGNESDVDENSRYVDGMKVHQRHSVGSFSGTIQAFTYPDVLFADILTQRQIPTFGLSYRITTDKAHHIHLVYNLKIPRGEISYNQSDAGNFSWPFTTLPMFVPGAKPSAHLVITTSLAYSWTVAALESVLYGDESRAATLPDPSEVFDIFEENSILQIIDHGDGTWTARGPDSVIQMLDSTTFSINWPSAVYIDADSYTIHSL